MFLFVGVCYYCCCDFLFADVLSVLVVLSSPSSVCLYRPVCIPNVIEVPQLHALVYNQLRAGTGVV